MVTDEEVFAFLEHAGVLGMKWGVRRQRRNQALSRAARPGAGIATKVRAFHEENLIDLIKGRGIKGGARIRQKRLSQRINRIKAGKGSARDIIVHFGSTRMQDLIPVRSKNAKKKTSARTDVAVVAGLGALFAAGFIAKQAKMIADPRNI